MKGPGAHAQTLGIDPAERNTLMRCFYHDLRPTRAGRWVDRLMCWLAGTGCLQPRRWPLRFAVESLGVRVPSR